MTHKLSLLLFYFFFATISLISSAQKKNVIFTDVTKKAGIHFKYTYGDNSYKNILESSGSGITIFDYNNDGLMDLYLMNGTYLEGISDPSGKI
jgi:enediyne biosynthesis protein E4